MKMSTDVEYHVEQPSGAQMWSKDGKLHRTDGPALVESDGMVRWWLDGIEFDTFDEWFEKVQVSDEDKTLLKLKYG